MEEAKQRGIYRIFFRNSSARWGWIVLAALAFETVGSSLVDSFWLSSNRGVRLIVNSPTHTFQKLFPDVIARVERRKAEE